MNIIETSEDLEIFLSYLKASGLYIYVVGSDYEKHPCNNNVSLLFFYIIKNDMCWCFPLKHNEAVCHPEYFKKIKDCLRKSTHKKIVNDKKSFLQFFGDDCDFIDIDILRFLVEGKEPTEVKYTAAHDFVKNNFKNYSDLNVCVSLFKHAKVFQEQVELLKNIKLSDIDDKGFVFTNNRMANLFAVLESNGLCVSEDFTDFFGEDQSKNIKGDIVFSQYNLLTSTGRPSNRFGGVNYAALNKTDGSRNCFVSRYKKDGMLVMMDYNAFHPRLIAHLANFHMVEKENPYEYLAKYYFNKDKITQEDISISKGFTFTQIYGGIDKKWMHIPYFSKVQQYIDHRWKFFKDNGYVETPKYGRKIKECHIQDPSPNKLFNYILQAFETEMAVDVLGEIISYLRGKKTMPILYTYDSILFDAHKEDKMVVIKTIKKMMEQDKFPVKVYVGKTYGDMKQIDL